MRQVNNKRYTPQSLPLMLKTRLNSHFKYTVISVSHTFKKKPNTFGDAMCLSWVSLAIFRDVPQTTQVKLVKRQFYVSTELVQPDSKPQALLPQLDQ